MKNENTEALPAWNPHQSWGGLMVETGAKIAQHGKKALQKAQLEHLSYGRIGVLSILLVGQETQARLSFLLGQKPQSMRELLQRLLKEGLIENSPDAHDGRKTNWRLTLKGRADIAKAKAVFKKTGAMIDDAFKKLSVSEKEIQRFKQILIGLNEQLTHHQKGSHD